MTAYLFFPMSAWKKTLLYIGSSHHLNMQWHFLLTRAKKPTKQHESFFMFHQLFKGFHFFCHWMHSRGGWKHVKYFRGIVPPNIKKQGWNADTQYNGVKSIPRKLYNFHPFLQDNIGYEKWKIDKVISFGFQKMWLYLKKAPSEWISHHCA